MSLNVTKTFRRKRKLMRTDHQQLSGDFSDVDHVVEDTREQLAEVVLVVEAEQLEGRLGELQQSSWIAVGARLVDSA